MLAGSVAGLGDDALLPPGSDVDVWLVLADGAYPSDRAERFVHVDGLALDVAYLPGAALRSSERILGTTPVPTRSPGRTCSSTATDA